MKNNRLYKTCVGLGDDIADVISKPKQMLSLDFFKIVLPMILLSALSTARAQTGPDISGALDDAQEAAFGVMDWAFIIVIAAIFLIGAVGLCFGLVKVFSGRAAEGVTSLIVGIVCIILVAVLVAVFYTFYQDAVTA